MTEHAEADARTTPQGLFAFAESYRCAADELARSELECAHPEAAREFLYFLAIELFLKAFLRQRGVSVADVERFDHRYAALAHAYTAHGGVLDSYDLTVLDYMHLTGAVIRSRYVQTRFYRKAPIQALSRTAKSLHEHVGAELGKSGEFADQSSVMIPYAINGQRSTPAKSNGTGPYGDDGQITRPT